MALLPPVVHKEQSDQYLVFFRSACAHHTQEKFSKWDDRGTGVNPFVPLPPRIPSNVVVRMIRAGASWIIAAIVRAPFVAMLFGLLYCASGLSTLVSWAMPECCTHQCIRLVLHNIPSLCRRGALFADSVCPWGIVGCAALR